MTTPSTADHVTSEIQEKDRRQVQAYARALGIQTPSVQRLPVRTEFGGRVSGLRWGEKHQAALLHGGQLNAHTWDGVLLRAGVSAIAYDLPGHGHSLRLEAGSYTVEKIASLVAEQIQKDFGRPIPLIGHSFGASIALSLAAQEPHLCSELVFLDSTPHGVGTAGGDPETLHCGTLDELIDSVHVRVPQRTRESLIRGVKLNAVQRTDGLWQWCWDLAYKNDSPARGQERNTLWEAVREIKCPVTLVRGELSEKCTAQMVTEFCAIQPRTKTATAPAAGHNIHTDQPGWTADLLRSVLGPSR